MYDSFPLSFDKETLYKRIRHNRLLFKHKLKSIMGEQECPRCYMEAILLSRAPSSVDNIFRGRALAFGVQQIPHFTTITTSEFSLRPAFRRQEAMCVSLRSPRPYRQMRRLFGRAALEDTKNRGSLLLD